MSSATYSVKNLGDYKVFLPPENYYESKERKTARTERKKRNDAFLREHGLKPALKPITGSFIYAHPPNYQGQEAFRWDAGMWKKALIRLQGYGIDTVIFQAALWKELGECYYPSQFFSSFRKWNVIEPMLQSAGELGMDVYLGGYGSVTCWHKKLNADIVNEEMTRQKSCFHELLRYRKYFKGFYFSPESAYAGKRDMELECALGDLYYGLFSDIRHAEPELSIMMSPATFYHPEGMGQMCDAWCSIFNRAHPDILAPQDSIGCGCISLDRQIEALRIWREIADRCQIELWSNVECFECCEPYYDETSRRAAAPERVIAQINNAAPYVSKLITWELLYYGDPDVHAPGRPLIEEIFL